MKMSINHYDNLYEDYYEKTECQKCKRSFIVGHTLSQGMTLCCPYCRSEEIEIVVSTNEEIDLGCLGFYFRKYENGSLMLYTGHELHTVMNTYKESHQVKTITFSEYNRIMADYCKKRDGIT